MKDVLCIAEVCCDILFGGLDQLPQPGREEYCREFGIMAGGGANTAAGLARLGVPTRLATMVGGDFAGRLVYDSLRSAGLDMRAVRTEPAARTPVSAVLSTGADRAFASFGGDGPRFLDAAALPALLQGARHVHTFAGYAAQFDLPALCRRYGCTLSLDTSWVETSHPAMVRQVLRGCDVFFPNADEARALTGTDTPEAALAALAADCPRVVVTLGAGGCLSRGADGGNVYTPAVDMGPFVDSTGAGDLFCAGYVYGWLNGWTHKRAAALAVRAGGLAATRYGGCFDGFTLDALEAGGI